MKKLALVISLCPLWLAACASQDPGPAQSQDATAEAGPSSALEMHQEQAGTFSAHQALMTCLKAVREGSGSAGVSIRSLSSQLRTSDNDQVAPVVDVEMSLVFQAETQQAADEAFESVRSALANMARSGADPVTYRDAVDSFVSLSPSASGPDGTLKTHEATLKVELPAARLRPATSKQSHSASSAASYVRSIAASDSVHLPVSIATRRPTTVGMQSLEIRPAKGTGDHGDSSIDRARIANFLYQLEKNSKSVQITAVELKEPEGERFEYFKTQINAPR